ncbi:MAG TPA: hypothetical protein VMQ86_02315 [Bryobacteraceae bacterium]|jgi:regulator of protease activity HflC (stomatin/prohibitin superfamily)|nr:hypothetical protein [Bryobacteraceae bacterium]
MARVEMLEARRQAVEVSGQEILTQDKVAVRVNISAVFEITGQVRRRRGAYDRCLSSAQRARTRQATNNDGLPHGTGVRVSEIALEDIILPRDIRRFLDQVVTAEVVGGLNALLERTVTLRAE